LSLTGDCSLAVDKCQSFMLCHNKHTGPYKHSPACITSGIFSDADIFKLVLVTYALSWAMFGTQCESLTHALGKFLAFLIS